MLTNKETFKILQTLDKIIDTKSNIISKEKHIDKDDIKSIIYMTTFNYIKKYYDNKKSKPITFFLNFAFPKSRVEIVRQMLPIKLSHGLIESGTHNNLSFTSLDINTGEEDDQSLYNLFGGYEDDTVDINDNKNYVNKLLSTTKLTKKEIDVLTSFYGIGCEQKTRHELMDQYHCSSSRIYELKNTAIRKIRKNISL